MKVYVVTSGSYSDYGMDAIFTDRKRAEEYSALLCESNGVDEWETDPVIKAHPPGTVPFSARIHLDPGLPVFVSRANPEGLSDDWQGSNSLEWGYVLIVWARDADHARKIASEKRSRIIALNLWGRPVEEVEGAIR